MRVSWYVEYKSGKRFPAIGPDGAERSYDDIPDRDEISIFCLFNVDTKKPVFTVYLDEGQKLIYRRRVFKRPGGVEDAFYLAGWRMDVGGKCIQSIAYVHEGTGYVQLAGKFREKHVLFDSPVLREFEKVAGE